MSGRIRKLSEIRKPTRTEAAAERRRLVFRRDKLRAALDADPGADAGRLVPFEYRLHVIDKAIAAIDEAYA